MSNSFTTLACQAPLSMRFPRQKYWNGLPFSSPGDLPNPGIKPASPELAGRFFTTEPQGKPYYIENLDKEEICWFWNSWEIDLKWSMITLKEQSNILRSRANIQECKIQNMKCKNLWRRIKRGEEKIGKKLLENSQRSDRIWL